MIEAGLGARVARGAVVVMAAARMVAEEMEEVSVVEAEPRVAQSEEESLVEGEGVVIAAVVMGSQVEDQAVAMEGWKEVVVERSTQSSLSSPRTRCTSRPMAGCCQHTTTHTVQAARLAAWEVATTTAQVAAAAARVVAVTMKEVRAEAGRVAANES